MNFKKAILILALLLVNFLSELLFAKECLTLKIESVYSVYDTKLLKPILKSRFGNGINVKINSDVKKLSGVLTNWHLIGGNPNHIFVSCDDLKEEFKIESFNSNSDLVFLIPIHESKENKNSETNSFFSLENIFGNQSSKILNKSKEFEFSLINNKNELTIYKPWYEIKDDDNILSYFFILNPEFSKLINLYQEDEKFYTEYKSQSSIYNEDNISDNGLLRINNGKYMKNNDNGVTPVFIGNQQVYTSENDGLYFGLPAIQKPILITNFAAWFGLSGSPVFKSNVIAPDKEDFDWDSFIGLVAKTEINGSSSVIVPKYDIEEFLRSIMIPNESEGYFLSYHQDPVVINSEVIFKRQLIDENSSIVFETICENGFPSTGGGEKTGSDWGSSGGENIDSKEQTLLNSHQNYSFKPNFSHSLIIENKNICDDGVNYFYNKGVIKIKSLTTNKKTYIIKNIDDLLQVFELEKITNIDQMDAFLKLVKINSQDDLKNIILRKFNNNSYLSKTGTVRFFQKYKWEQIKNKIEEGKFAFYFSQFDEHEKKFQPSIKNKCDEQKCLLIYNTELPKLNSHEESIIQFELNFSVKDYLSPDVKVRKILNSAEECELSSSEFDFKIDNNLNLIFHIRPNLCSPDSQMHIFYKISHGRGE